MDLRLEGRMRKRNMRARPATKATTPMTMPAMAPAERVSWWELPRAVAEAEAEALDEAVREEMVEGRVEVDARVVVESVVDGSEVVVESVLVVAVDVASVVAVVVAAVAVSVVAVGTAVSVAAVAGATVATSVGIWKPVGISATLRVPVTVISIGTATPVGAPVGTSGNSTVTKTFASCGLRCCMFIVDPGVCVYGVCGIWWPQSKGADQRRFSIDKPGAEMRWDRMGWDKPGSRNLVEYWDCTLSIHARATE